MGRNTNQLNFELEPTKKIIIGSKNEADSFFLSPLWSLSYYFPWNPDPLCPGNDYSIYDEMHNDDQVKSALSIKKDMVVNTGWIIQGENPEINDFITKTFENINVGTGWDYTFDDTLRDILSAYGYGFSLSEPVHTIKDGKVIYKSLRTRPPHSFKFEVDAKGNIVQIIQSTLKGDINFKSTQFLHHIYQMEFGNPYGKSDLKAAYAAWKAKKFFTRFFAIYVEKYASPPLVGKYPKTYTDDQVADFFDKLKALQNATSYAIPDDVTMEFVQHSRDASDIYLKGLDYYNMQIARSILVPDLLGIGGTETKGGSYALGKEQFKVFLSSIKKDRESLERKITSKLVRPLVLANFGDIPSWFEFKPFTFDDVKEYLALWVQAVTGKVYKPNDEEINYFRQATGFPEGNVEPAPAPAPMFGGNPNGFGNAGNGNNEDEKTKPEQSKEDVEKAEEEKKELKLFAYRELTKYEKKVDFKKVERTFDSAEDKISKRVFNATKQIYNDLITQIREKGLLKKFKPEAIESLKPRYQKDLKKVFKTYYADLFKEAYNGAQKEVFPDKPSKYVEELLPDEFLELLEVEAFKNVGDYSFETTKRVKNILIHGIKDGTPANELIGILRDELGATSEIWANTVVRTKTTEIYNEARKKYFETDSDAKQIVVGYQWSSILDDRTSDICQYLDGKIFEIGELSDRVKPPAHFNCRSLLVPITKFEDYKKDPNSDFTESKLKDKGGNLLFPGANARKRFQFEDKPALVNSNMINLFGDTVVIAAAGAGRFISIQSIYASNSDLEKPVIIGFKGQNDSELKYKTLLDKSGGLLQKDFSDNPWRLEENTGFIINLSAPINVEYTVEYIISSIDGNRIQ